MDTLIHSRAAAEQYLELTKGITPALIFNPKAVTNAWQQLQSALPGVTLYYAVKSNPYESILSALNAEGAQFDCASAPEIEALLELGVSVDRVIHTHPIKTTNDLQLSYDLGVRTFVVDNADELWKLVPFRRDVRIMLRLSFVAPDAPIDLSRKFGAQPEDAMELLSVAKHMGLEVDGLCFHVGSQAASATTHSLALRRCFDIAKEAKERSIGFRSYVGYLMAWNEYYAPKALNAILQKGLRAKVSMKNFNNGGNAYEYGTIFIPVQNQKLNVTELYQFLENTAKDSHVKITGVSTGLNDGIDLGSNNFRALKMPKAAMLIGNGVSSYEAGEVWHLLDTRIHIPITKIQMRSLRRASLDRYNTLVMVSGGYNQLDSIQQERLKSWTSKGNTLITIANASKWAVSNKLVKNIIYRHIAEEINFI